MLFATNGDVISWGPTAGSLFSSVVSAGFAGWLAWYLVTKAMPRQQDKFETVLKDQQAAFAVNMKERRTEHTESLRAVIDHCERESLRRDQSFKESSAETNQTIHDTREVLEEVRDMLRQVRELLQAAKRGN